MYTPKGIGLAPIVVCFAALSLAGCGSGDSAGIPVSTKCQPYKDVASTLREAGLADTTKERLELLNEANNLIQGIVLSDDFTPVAYGEQSDLGDAHSTIPKAMKKADSGTASFQDAVNAAIVPAVKAMVDCESGQ